MGTFSRFLAAWGEGNYKRRGNEYRGHRPGDPQSDGNAFTITFEDEEHAPWYDHKNGNGGSLYQICELVGVEVETQTITPTTLREFKGLADYAAAQGKTAALFAGKWKWREVMHYCGQRKKEAPALEFQTKGGKRYRMLDGLKPKYLSEVGFKPCWYGLQFALDMLPNAPVAALVLCNGEPSTIVAQDEGIPAVCAPGGEKRLPDELLNQLKIAYPDGDIWIVFDCDDTGRRAAKEVKEQLDGLGYRASVLDLGLYEHGDLANFCTLYGVASFEKLAALVPPMTTGAITSQDAAHHAVNTLFMPPEGETLVFPFKALHRLGGMCHIIAPGEVVIIAGISGGGKTSFMECLTEPIIRRGAYVLWDGKEWNPAKMHARRIQRLTGITTEEQKLHNHWKSEQQRGIAENAREGIRFTPEQEQRYIDASYQITNFPGHVEYVPMLPYLEDTLEVMRERLAYYRRRGIALPCVVFDYAQLWKLRSVNNAPSNLFEYALDTVKDWTLTNNTISFVLSQSNKTEADKVKVADTEYLLGSGDAQYIRDDKCNLMITLNPQYEEDRNHMHNGKAQLRKRDYLIANVVKNSDGREGFVRLQTWWERLMVMDKVKASEKVDLSE